MSQRIEHRLTEVELHKKTEVINRQYAGKKFTHLKTSDTYEVFGAIVINYSEAAWWGLILHKIDETGFAVRNVPFTYTLDEFTDGRFIEIK